MPRIHENHMTVGKMIEALSAQKPDATVYFDFCHTEPTGIDSYRGYYEDVAIGWAPDGGLNCGQLLAEFVGANGKTQEGYKGGTFNVHDGTAVWVANWGRTGDTAVVGVENVGWAVIIHTANAD